MRKSQKLHLKLLLLVLCFACLVCSLRPAAASADEAAPKAQTLTTLVRYRPYFSSEVIGQMENGTEIQVLSETETFYKVDCYDTNGYIAKSQVVHNEEENTYHIRCVKDSTETCTMQYEDHCTALNMRNSLLALAKKQLGSRYVYGSSRPGAFDCSGLVYYLYGKHNIDLHRNASAQMQDGIIVAKEGLQVGDLIFFREPGEYTLCSHVGIYVGNNQIIHSGSKGVVYADLDGDYFADYYLCARRIINTNSTGTTLPGNPNLPPVALPVTGGRR